MFFESSDFVREFNHSEEMLSFKCLHDNVGKGISCLFEAVKYGAKRLIKMSILWNYRYPLTSCF